MHDLGEQQLKDIQHEHIYEISVDGATRRFAPLKTEPTEDFESKLKERINSYVEVQLERSLSGEGPPKVPMRFAAGGMAILLLFVATLVVIALVVKLAFF